MYALLTAINYIALQMDAMKLNPNCNTVKFYKRKIATKLKIFAQNL